MTVEDFARFAAVYRQVLRGMTPEQLDHAESCNSCVPHGAALIVLVERERTRRVRAAARAARKAVVA